MSFVIENLRSVCYYVNFRSHMQFSLIITWWCHRMETFSALLAICVRNSPVPGEFPAQRPVTRNFDVFFDLLMNKQLSKQLWCLWFEMLSHPLWCHHNDKDSFLHSRHLFTKQTNYFTARSCEVLTVQDLGLDCFSRSKIWLAPWQ